MAAGAPMAVDVLGQKCNRLLGVDRFGRVADRARLGGKVRSRRILLKNSA